MVDSDLIIAKAGSVRKHLKRVEKKRGRDAEVFQKDLDRQDIISFNIQMAIQNCIDIAAHIISEEGLGIPGSINDMIYILEENGYLSSDLTQKMVKATGFRNILVHEYGKIELEQVYEIACVHIYDLNEYLLSIFSKLGISEGTA